MAQIQAKVGDTFPISNKDLFQNSDQQNKVEQNELKEQEMNLHLENKMELAWNNLTITAKIQVPVVDEKTGKKVMQDQEKVILDNLKGRLKPGTFTAILGPSGSGKTTLLNLLSGRLASNNMKIYGEMYLNKKLVPDTEKYSNYMAYVMQDDILLSTFTPKEAFTFIANLRLPLLSEKQKSDRVEHIIQELGLQKCQNTRVGNELIRGVSGGERKRTSIGVELLTNPSMLFLDEPTTGLDSSTALDIVQHLKHLAMQGVNVVSTIHQPSSEIFDSFQSLLLLVRGRIIYQGDSHQAVHYFASIGYPLPPYSNPSDFFMKLMNEEGLMIEKLQNKEELPADEVIEQEFQQRVKVFETSYNKSDMFKTLEPAYSQELVQSSASSNVGIFSQFQLLFGRAFLNEIRNPMDVRMKFAQQVIFAIAVLIVFSDLGDPNTPGKGQIAIQNRQGVLFFLMTMQAFGSIQGSIATFSAERSLFLRERLNKSYGVGVYFWGKSLAEFPFQLLYPTVGIAIVYFVIGLYPGADEFWMLVFIAILVYWQGTAYGLLISVFVPKLELAMALIPVLVIPLMVMGGFFVNTNTIPVWLKWIEYISMFKYGFQAACINEFTKETFDCGKVIRNPLDTQFLILAQKMNQQLFQGTKNIYTDPFFESIDIKPCNPLQSLDFKETLAQNLWILFGLGLAFRLIALVGMYVISNPKRPRIEEPRQEDKQKALAQ